MVYNSLIRVAKFPGRNCVGILQSSSDQSDEFKKLSKIAVW